MRENALIRRLLNTNTFILICIMFTVATLLDLALTVAFFGDVGTTYQHLGTRFIICAFVSASLLIFRYFEKTPFALTIGIHLLVVMIFVVLFVWISGFFAEQHPNAMFYMVRSVLIVYLPVGIGLVIADHVLKGKNRK